MSATVIVPTVNGRERLARLLTSLNLNEYEVLVVDNGSTDGTHSMLAELFPPVRVLRLERNEGFSKAVNLAASRAQGNVLVLLNDDCVCDPGFVQAVANEVAPVEGIVMAAAVLRRWNHPDRIESAGMEIDHTLLVWEHLHDEPLTRLDDGVADPIGPSAAAAAFDRETFLAAGGFDERLFAYWEDVDLVLRLRLEGGRCRLALTARGVHEHATTLGSGSPEKNYLMGFGRAYLIRKWGALTLRRLPAILAREVPICIGQAVVDQNLAGVRGRVAGYRAARFTTSRVYPCDVLAGHAASGTFTTLRRRAHRRARPARQPSGVA